MICELIKLRVNCLRRPCITLSGVKREHENIIPRMKYSGGSIMIWSFAASGPGQLDLIKRKNDLVILQHNVWVAACQLKLSRNWVIEQVSDPKH